jgi:hypothetical protein
VAAAPSRPGPRSGDRELTFLNLWFLRQLRAFCVRVGVDVILPHICGGLHHDRLYLTYPRAEGAQGAPRGLGVRHEAGDCADLGGG